MLYNFSPVTTICLVMVSIDLPVAGLTNSVTTVYTPLSLASAWCNIATRFLALLPSTVHHRLMRLTNCIESELYSFAKFIKPIPSFVIVVRRNSWVSPVDPVSV